MRTLSGNYPEVWVSYKISTEFGVVHRHLVKDVHTLALAAEVFAKDPPKLPQGAYGIVVAVSYWVSPSHNIEVKDFGKPLIGYKWPKNGLYKSRKARI